MTNREKYYRRSCAILKQLEDHFHLLINPDKTIEFIVQKKLELKNNEGVINEQILSLLVTSLITLMALNKEEIEKLYDIKYQINKLDFDILNLIKFNDSQKLKSELEQLRIKNTIFDNWLVIKKQGNKEITNLEYLKIVRNAFLHSEFQINYNDILDTINIKNKSYFEADIIFLNFLQFAMNYFGNNIGSGLVTNNMLFITDSKINITNYSSLRKYLENLEIIDLVLDNNDYNFYDELLLKHRNEKYELDIRILDSLDGKVKEVSNNKLSKNQIDFISGYIENSYGNDFYKLNQTFKQNYVTELCSLIFNTKNYLSSWILYICDFLYKINNNQFSFIDLNNRNYCQEGFYIVLSLLKSYLILYRLQSSEFLDIDYENLEINIDCIKLLANNSTDVINIQKRYPDIDNNTLEKIRIIQIIRNALAHGNIKVLLGKSINTNEFNFLLEFTDQYKDSIRKVQITLDELNKILDSEVFLPKYCYSNVKQKIKK
ncbi:MAG: hypothetical protein IJ501_02745 [Bacilli bacterium]|nr:hypothetical protein [Bacilli bacterium]